MNNGCICCTVRGDLIRIIDGLMRRKGKFDAIIVETTGLADPAPVAQTFFVDEDVGKKARLDAVVTVADAKWLHDRLQGRAGGEEPDRLRRRDPAQQDRPRQRRRAARGRGAHPRHQSLCQAAPHAARADRRSTRCSAATPSISTASSTSSRSSSHADDHDHDHDHHHDHDHGHHHHPRRAEALSRRGHAIDLAATDKPLDPGQVLPLDPGPGRRTRARTSCAARASCRFKDDPKRFVFQGVHMILDGDHQRDMEATARSAQSRIVFIGRNLPEEKIRKGFESCVRGRSQAGSVRVTRASRRYQGSTSPPSSIAPARCGGRAGGRRAFPRRHARRSCSARRRCCCRRERRGAAHRACMAAASWRPPSDGTRIVTGGDDGKVVATDARRRERDDRDRREAPLDRSRRARAGRRGGLVAPASRRSCAPARASQVARGAFDRRRAGLRAEGLAARDRALQRRVALVSQRAGRARDAGMEGLASRRAVQPGRQVPGHRDAGADAAWLAPRRRQAHAHVGLCGAGALDGVDAGRQWLATVRLRAADPVAVPGKDGPMGKQPSMLAPYASARSRSRCHPKQEVVAVGYRTARAAGADRRRRRDPGEEAGERRRSRRSPGARPATCWRGAPRTARPGSWI